MRDYRKVVTDKIAELGVKEASKFFGVSLGTISNWATGKTSPSIDALQLAAPEEVEQEAAQEEHGDPDALFQWQGRKAMLLLPVYRTFNPDTHFTLFANYAKYGPEKVGMIMQKRTVIHEARNILADKYLKTDAPKAIFCDDDMILPSGQPALFNGRYGAKVSNEKASVVALSRLMSHGDDKPIVGSLYFGRNEDGMAQCHKGKNEPGANTKFRNGTYKGLVADNWVGTGFMRINREVFLAMKQAIDDGKWGDDLKPRGNNGIYGFFTPLKVKVGEDVSFCLRAKELGFQSYIDTGLVCLHAGEELWGPSNTKSQ
jgi:transcriptional regulator with XRE-family HTH domain